MVTMANTTFPKQAPQLKRVAKIRGGVLGAWEDLVRGVSSAGVWWALAIQEIRRRYRRSIIGPFWLTLTMGVTVMGLGLLYAKLFKIDLELYLPYLTVGFVIWGHIAPTTGESCSTFISAGTIIKQSTTPLSIHLMKIIATNTIVFFHNVVIFFIVAFLFNVHFGPSWMLALVALLIINVTLFGIGLFLAVVSTRFRDIPVIVNNVIMLAFFMTPILWQPTMLPDRTMFLRANPVYYLVELFRRPLLGQTIDTGLWVGSIVVMCASLILGLASFLFFRRRIAYWL